ncbi:MAG TPA: metalloregulator ArsR/SmtB family transcription factor [Rhodospirillales bacterium]|jgi:DNA-binding transcriptional ArsR family regulator|nr:metalloregulator ArsR/SmtB family transcription factor [Rhodospirillales bacterium]HJO68091.1 metalloregulator ArsR/SmtB family transcription factor [Rhodospirillales bacterium]
MDTEYLKANVAEASKLLKAMSNRHRLTVLCHLVHGEKRVGELEEITGLGQSALSQHLARLRRDDLVKTRRAAQTIYYSLSGGNAIAVIDALDRIYCSPQNGEVAGGYGDRPAPDRPDDPSPIEPQRHSESS